MQNNYSQGNNQGNNSNIKAIGKKLLAVISVIAALTGIIYGSIEVYYILLDHGIICGNPPPHTPTTTASGSTTTIYTTTTRTTVSTTTNNTSAGLDIPSVGSTFVFGTYQYESIPWVVLDKQNGRALLIAKYGLETIPYNSYKRLVNWNNCTLCDWMNGTFYNEAFTSTEQSYITYNNSVDQKIFALNRAEVEKYFPSSNQRRAYATDHAKSQGTYVNVKGYSPWWLRVEGNTSGRITVVDVEGDIDSDYNSSMGVTLDIVTARPAMWVLCN